MDKYEFRRQRLSLILREKCNGKPSILATKIGRDPSYVSRLLYPEGKKGKRRIADDLIEAIGTAFPEWLDDDKPSANAAEQPIARYTTTPELIAKAIAIIAAEIKASQNAISQGEGDFTDIAKVAAQKIFSIGGEEAALATYRICATEEECELLALYRRTNETGRISMLATTRALQQANPRDNNVEHFPVTGKRVANGNA